MIMNNDKNRDGVAAKYIEKIDCLLDFKEFSKWDISK